MPLVFGVEIVADSGHLSALEVVLEAPDGARELLGVIADRALGEVTGDHL